jgi:hypothetical protein
MMMTKHRFAPPICVGVLLLLGSVASFAACPGYSVPVPVWQLIVASTGASVVTYIQVDASAGAAADPCNCRVGNSLYLIRNETPVTEGTKMTLALAMEAKAMNKQVYFYSTACASSGYSNFSQFSLQP